MRCHSRLRATTIALLAGVLLAACGTAGKGGSPGPEAGQQLERLLEQAQVQSLPADVWVDDQGRLRKMQYTLKMRPKATGQQGSVTVNTTMELFDFGTTAKVETPPAGQVADFAEILKQGKGGSSG